MIRLTGGTPSYSSGPGGPRGSMVRGINPGESYTLLSKKGNQVPYTTQSCAYLLVTWRVVSSPPCRRVEDTSGLCSGWPAPLCSCSICMVILLFSHLVSWFYQVSFCVSQSLFVFHCSVCSGWLHWCAVHSVHIQWHRYLELSKTDILLCEISQAIVSVVDPWHTVRMAIFLSACLPPRRPGFDSQPGHFSPGTSSLGWRWPWSSLSIVVRSMWFETCGFARLQLGIKPSALQVLFDLHPSTFHVCSLFMYVRICSLGYSDFNNLMRFTSKKLPYIILNNVYLKSFLKV